MSAIVWVNGELIAEADASLSVTDHGISVGDGLFETMKVVEGTAFALTRHLNRLRRTAAGLGLEPPPDADIRSAVEATIAANDAGTGRVRVTVTGGRGPAGTSRGDGPPTVLVQCGPATKWPPTAKVAVVPWPRNERGALAGLKTTSYAENVIAYEHAVARGADEAIFPNTRDNLCEGTGTNVFVVLGGRLVTPPLSSGCLAGVTRELLLELDLDIEERDVPITAMSETDEAFLTSSTRDVQPIEVVDGRTLRAVGGPATTAAAEAFRELQCRTLDP